MSDLVEIDGQEPFNLKYQNFCSKWGHLTPIYTDKSNKYSFIQNSFPILTNSYFQRFSPKPLYYIENHVEKENRLYLKKEDIIWKNKDTSFPPTFKIKENKVPL